MLLSLRMLLGYCLGIVFLRQFDGALPYSSHIAANLVLIAALVPALLHLSKVGDFREKLHDCDPVRGRRKSLVIISGLVLLLVYAFACSILIGEPFSSFLEIYLFLFPVLVVVTPFYVNWRDSRQENPEDDYARFGAVLSGGHHWCFKECKPFILAWCVKIFFIPVMYGGLITALEQLLTYTWQANALSIIEGLFLFGLGFDLVIATAGYLLTTSLFRNSILAVDDNWISWCACLICYPPLLTVFRAVREQADTLLWFDWLQPTDWVYWVWGGLIVATWLIYWLSTASFGLQFSNLTWRGLIDVGPYRYSKHPAYISKNVYWWLHTVPFFGFVDWIDLARNILGLVFVGLVYYLRAKCEERFLMRFPEYVQYAEYVARYGLIARIKGSRR